MIIIKALLHLNLRKPTAAFRPSHTFNPIYHRIFDAIDYKAYYPSAESIPPCKNLIAAMVNPLPELQKRSRVILREIRQGFPTKSNRNMYQQKILLLSDQDFSQSSKKSVNKKAKRQVSLLSNYIQFEFC